MANMETCKKNVFFIYYGVLMFLSFQVSHVSSASDTISTNQPLSRFQTIVSSGNIFELGFFNPGTSDIELYIGMWYKQRSPPTYVWIANRESPVRNTTSTCLLKISDGNLILHHNFTRKSPIKGTDWRGGQKISNEILNFHTNLTDTLWSTGLNSSSRKDVQAVLLDNGNLVLRDGPTSSASVLWQSFDHPTDTWLPGAKFKLGSQLLTSWKSLTDPSPGRYSLKVDLKTHSLVMVWNGSKTYWSSGPLDDRLKIFKGFPYTGTDLSFKLNLEESYITYSVDRQSTYRFVMDVSGQFMMQVLRVDVQSWDVIFSQPEKRCEVYNSCGSFGICNDNEMLSPCTCVPGFKQAFREDSSDFSGGCKRETTFQCGEGNDKFLPIENMKLATDPTTTLLMTLNLVTTCASACLANCSCKAYAYDDHNCLMWTRYAFNLQQLDTDQGHTFFLKSFSFKHFIYSFKHLNFKQG